jgi:hypothetical protein
MILEVWVSDRLRVPFEREFSQFLQRMAARRDQGHAAYGTSRATKRYLSRLGRELDAYKRTGNQEHLLNVAVYAWLESVRPEREETHFDPAVASVTGREFGRGQKGGDTH